MVYPCALSVASPVSVARSAHRVLKENSSNENEYKDHLHLCSQDVELNLKENFE